MVSHCFSLRFRSCLTGALLLQLVLTAESAGSVIPTRFAADAFQIPFVANGGQTDLEVAFYANTLDGTVFITRAGEILYVLGKDQRGSVIRERFTGGLESVVEGTAPGMARVNYYSGPDRSRWLEGLPTFHTVSLGRKYELIDIQLISRRDGVEKIFIVHPGGRVADIRVRVQNARSLTIQETGHLLVSSARGKVLFTPPRAFQIKDKERVEVMASYRVDGHEYGFLVSGHDPTLPVVIDPLLSSTYLGGASNEAVYCAAVSGKDIIIAGTVDSPDFPGMDENVNALGDAFIVRLDPDLTAVLAATYIGGSMTDGVRDIVADERVIYAAGFNNSPDFPTTPGAAYSGTELSGAFVVRLDARTLQVTAATTFHSNVFALDRGGRRGDLYIGGSTGNPTFPIVAGSLPSYQATFKGGAEVFLAVMSNDLSTVKATTLLGGEGFDLIHDLAVDDMGRPVAVGVTNSTNFPVTGDAYDSSYNLNWGSTHSWIDGFVTRFSEDLSRIEASTYLGGGWNDRITAVTFDGPWVIVGGNTESADFPCGANFGPVDGNDAFVVRLDRELSELSSCAVFGGSRRATGSPEAVLDLGVHRNGWIYVAGRTNANDYPATEGAFLSKPAGSYFGAFLTAFSGDLSRLQASTLIHGGGEYLKALAFDPDGNVFVAGDTSAIRYPVTPGAVQPDPEGRDDLIISRFTPDLTGPHIQVIPPGVDFGYLPVKMTGTAELTINNTGGSDLVVREVTLATGPSRVFSLDNPCRTIVGFGSCPMTVTFSPERAGMETATLRIISSDPFQKELLIELTGSGIALPAIRVSSDLLAFEDVNPGGVSSAQLLSIKNTGTAGLNMIEVRLVGMDDEDFSLVSDSCSGAVLAPGADCILAVRFNPAGNGVKNAQLEIESSDPFKPVYPVRLTGNSTLFGQLDADPDPCDFGEVTVGSSLVKTVRFSNVGGVDLRLAMVVLDDDTPGEFDVVRDTCSGETLLRAAGRMQVPTSCEVDVSFSPASDGEKRGRLQVATEEPSVPAISVDITGSGVRPARIQSPGPLVWVAILILVLRVILGFPATAKGWGRWIKKSNRKYQ